MANEFDNEMTIAKDEIRQHHERMKKSEDAHMRCTGDHDGKDEFDGAVEAAGSVLGHSLATFPLSSLWMVGITLVGLGTGAFFETLGWGFMTLAIGWVIRGFALYIRDDD